MTTSPTRLGDVCELINGGAWKQTEYVDDGISVVQVSNMKNGTIDVSDLKFLPPTSYDRYKKHTLKECDLVIATVGSHATQASAAGRATIVKGFVAGMLLNQNAVAIRSKSESLNQDYLGLIGRSDKFQFYLGTVGQGAANQVRIALSAIKEYKCDLPPIGVQRRIAEVISAYDDLIENNRRRIQLLEQAARLLYKEWFVHLRFPGHEHVKIKDGVPEGWEKKMLGDIIEIKKGKNITKETASEGKIPVVAGGLTPAYFHNTPNATGPVITISASGANAGYVNIYHEDIWASDCSYISKESTEHIYYYYTLLKSKQMEIFVLQKGAAQPHVYPKDLMRISVVSPPDRILGYFADTISHTFTMTKNLITQNKSLTQARDLLLPRLMNGEVAV